MIRDKLAGRAAAAGRDRRAGATKLKDKYDCIGDVRGKGLYRMLDIVKDQKSKRAGSGDGGAHPLQLRTRRASAAIAVKHYFRFAPPLIITEAEIKDVVGRMDIAIKRAMDGFPRDVDVRESSSLSIGDRPVAAE